MAWGNNMDKNEEKSNEPHGPYNEIFFTRGIRVDYE
jgi:hypothetical protein